MIYKRVLANDGIDQAGKEILEKAGFFVETNKAAENHLIQTINDGNFDVLLVRSATKVTAAIIESCRGLKVIGRAGVGLDNIDLNAAKAAGIHVINTPAASSQSVAELVLAHLFSGVRYMQESNYIMRSAGQTQFAALKKKFGNGSELRGKTLGIIGFGRIGQALARMAAGMGMNVIATDPYIQEVTLHLEIPMAKTSIPLTIKTVSMEEVLENSDFISLHVPGKVNGKAVVGAQELSRMKSGAGIVNASRGGVIDEDALLHALDTGKLAFAGLDVFENEPTPREDLLKYSSISLSPHIGAATAEAQERIGIELASLLVDYFKSL
jgi:D-3-phosphoglycerate dehydrogenase